METRVQAFERLLCCDALMPYCKVASVLQCPDTITLYNFRQKAHLGVMWNYSKLA